MERLLVVEDERKLLRSLQRGLDDQGYSVATTATGDDAQAMLRAELNSTPGRGTLAIIVLPSLVVSSGSLSPGRETVNSF